LADWLIASVRFFIRHSAHQQVRNKCNEYKKSYATNAADAVGETTSVVLHPLHTLHCAGWKLCFNVTAKLRSALLSNQTKSK